MNYQLRLGLNELVHAGLLDRQQYYSLVEVLAEARHYMPQHADDVTRAELLLAKLLALVQVRSPHTASQAVDLAAPRQRIAIIGLESDVTATIAAWRAHPYGQQMELTGVHLPPGTDEKHALFELRDLLKQDLPLVVGEMRGVGLGRTAALLEALEEAEKPVTVLPFKMGYEAEPLPPTTPPKPHFNGYMDKKGRRKWPRPK